MVFCPYPSVMVFFMRLGRAFVGVVGGGYGDGGGGGGGGGRQAMQWAWL